MSYTFVKSINAEYAVDWEVIERFCLSYWTTYHQLSLADTVKLSESSWYNPFSWSLPAIRTVDVDWDKVRTAARTACASDMSTYTYRAARDMRGIALDVKWKVEQTAANRRAFINTLKDVQSENITEMQRAESDYTGLIDACRFIRDTSADVVAIGSTIATGGAGVGLLGASSALKGVGKYQDTGKAGSAVLYGAGSMVLGAFKVSGAKLTTGSEYTLIMAQGFLETGSSLTAGDGFAKAIQKGGLKVASAGTAQALFSASWVKTIFSRMPIPFSVFSITSRQGVNVMETDMADTLLEKTAKKMTEKGVSSNIKARFGSNTKGSAGSQPNSVSRGLIDEVPVEEMLLLNFGIVNMENGVGRGW